MITETLQTGHDRTASYETDAPWVRRYKAFAKLAYWLRRECAVLPILGASLLHPRHPLPAAQMAFLDILEKAGRKEADRTWIRSLLPSPVRMLKQWGVLLLFSFRDTVMLIILHVRFGRAFNRLMRARTDMILKSWAVNRDILRTRRDFYFGDLHEQLAGRGLSVLHLYGDSHGSVGPSFSKAVFESVQHRTVPEFMLVPLWAPLRTAFVQIRTGLKLRRMARRVPDMARAALCAEVSASILHPFTLRNTLQYYMTHRAVRMTGAKAFLTLYEGQPLEALNWQGAKDADETCRTVGFQHTIVMPHSETLLHPNEGGWERADLDLVLCVGDVTHRMLTESNAGQIQRYLSFGSFRRLPVKSECAAPDLTRKTVLVLPEGVLEEERLIFNFAIRMARHLPDYRFIFRCHPIMPFEKVRLFLEEDPRLLTNIEISKSVSVEEDYRRASVLLYRGTSAVFYAIQHGLKALYLHSDGHVDVDPLFELSSWRDVVCHIDEALQSMRNLEAQSADTTRGEWEKAMDYVRRYVKPVEDDGITRFLRRLDITDPGEARA